MVFVVLCSVSYKDLKRFQVAPNVQIKQQLPLKLATKLGSGSSTLPAGVGSGAGPTQILPMKLSSMTGPSPGGPGDRRSTGAYQRLSSPPEGPPAPSHTRTGSSPAMMQNVQVRNQISYFTFLRQRFHEYQVSYYIGCSRMTSKYFRNTFLL